jgi:crotonobetainyl-CoA:carnitine CoA-transferase CaiB-like acyl-CoA transferase
MNENHQELYKELEKIFKQYDLNEIVEKLRFSEVTFGVLSKSSDHKKDKQFLKNEVLVNFSKDSFETENLTVNSPIFLKDELKKTPSRGPDLGEHSKEILSGIGIDSKELDKLKEDGVIDF